MSYTFFTAAQNRQLDAITSGTNGAAVPDGQDYEFIVRSGASFTKSDAVIALERIRNAIVTGAENLG